jgi:transposase InsO family protein
LKTLRTDEGKEFDNESLNSERKWKGVEHEMTTRYTPQSNGRAERVNRTLFECVQAMLVAAKCPKILWDEALRTACTVRNVSSCGAGRAKTQYELFWGIKANKFYVASGNAQRSHRSLARFVRSWIPSL